MNSTDLRKAWCVAIGVALLSACAAGPAKKTTTPAAGTGTGTAGGDEKPSPTAGGGDEVLPLGEEPKAAAPAPAPAPPEPEKETDVGPRPPTQDLPKDKRDALAKEQQRRAVAALKARDTDGFIRYSRAALDIDETSVEAMIMLAHGYYLKEYDDKAEAVLNIARKQRAGDAHPVLWMLLGLVYDRTNREDQALAAYERATQLKPDYFAALTNRGAIYLKRKRYADAIGVFEQVTQVHDKSPRAHTNLGAAYRGRSADFAAQQVQREQLLKRAEAELKMAMSQDPSYAPAYFNIGILYLDADPFPGLDTMQRLQLASKFLSDYKRTAGPTGVPAADDYLAAAQKGIEREQKLLDRKRKKDADKQRKGGGT